MNIAVIYSTNSGGTFLIAEKITNFLSKKNSLKLFRAEEFDFDLIDRFDCLFLGTPTWQTAGKDAMPHEFMLDFLRKIAEKQISPKKYVVFGCGNSSFTIFCGGVDYVDISLRSLGWIKIYDSLKIDGYYFDLKDNNAEIDRWLKNFELKKSAV